ncbi:MAG: RNA methyltransferase [Pseudomonadota bacterium]
MENGNERRPRGGLEALSEGPVMILVEPQLGENIGAAARAMLNFGLADMGLVAPRDGWPNEKAVAMASGAAAILERAQLFPTTAEALADRQYVLATTARPREMLLPVYSPEEAAADLKKRIGDGQKCAVLFGAERRGLENADVLKADGVISIPVNPAFPSLNLAQAVLIVGYEWAKIEGRSRMRSDLDAAVPAPKADFERLMAHLTEALDDARFFHPPEKRPTKVRNLTVALARAGLTEGEVRALRGVIKALQRSTPSDDSKQDDE